MSKNTTVKKYQKKYELLFVGIRYQYTLSNRVLFFS